jgi:hypothetical protein
MQALNLSENYKKQVSVVYKLPSLWYSAITTQNRLWQLALSLFTIVMNFLFIHFLSNFMLEQSYRRVRKRGWEQYFSRKLRHVTLCERQDICQSLWKCEQKSARSCDSVFKLIISPSRALCILAYFLTVANSYKYPRYHKGAPLFTHTLQVCWSTPFYPLWCH